MDLVSNISRTALVAAEMADPGSRQKIFDQINGLTKLIDIYFEVSGTPVERFGAVGVNHKSESVTYSIIGIANQLSGGNPTDRYRLTMSESFLANTFYDGNTIQITGLTGAAAALNGNFLIKDSNSPGKWIDILYANGPKGTADGTVAGTTLAAGGQAIYNDIRVTNLPFGEINDTDAIQEAIDYVAETSPLGGVVNLKPGKVYPIDGIKLFTRVILQGGGKVQSGLYLRPNANRHVVEIIQLATNDSPASIENCGCRDMFIYGNQFNQAITTDGLPLAQDRSNETLSDGIHVELPKALTYWPNTASVTGNVDACLQFSNLIIRRCCRNGMYCDGSGDWGIDRIEISNCGMNGVDTLIYDSTWKSIIVSACGASGFRVSQGANNFNMHDCLMYFNGTNFNGWLNTDANSGLVKSSDNNYPTRVFTAAAGSAASLVLSDYQIHQAAAHMRVSLTTTGVLPAGLSTGVDYYIKAIPNNRTMTLSLTRGGADIAVSDAGTGVHSLKVRPDINQASPAVLTWSTLATRLTVGSAFYLKTTGTLPAPLSVNTPYYVVSINNSSGAITFSDTRGGAAINTTDAGSGQITVIPVVTFTAAAGVPSVVTSYNHGLGTGRIVAFQAVDGGVLPTGVPSTAYVKPIDANTFWLTSASSPTDITSIDVSTSVITKNAHGLLDGDPVVLHSRGRTMPGGLSRNGLYYVAQKTSNTFKLSTTPDGLNVVTMTSEVGEGVANYHRVVILSAAGSGLVTMTRPDYNIETCRQKMAGFYGERALNMRLVNVKSEDTYANNFHFEYIENFFAYNLGMHNSGSIGGYGQIDRDSGLAIYPNLISSLDGVRAISIGYNDSISVNIHGFVSPAREGQYLTHVLYFHQLKSEITVRNFHVDILKGHKVDLAGNPKIDAPDYATANGLKAQKWVAEVGVEDTAYPFVFEDCRFLFDGKPSKSIYSRPIKNAGSRYLDSQSPVHNLAPVAPTTYVAEAVAVQAGGITRYTVSGMSNAQLNAQYYFGNVQFSGFANAANNGLFKVVTYSTVNKTIDVVNPGRTVGDGLDQSGITGVVTLNATSTFKLGKGYVGQTKEIVLNGPNIVQIDIDAAAVFDISQIVLDTQGERVKLVCDLDEKWRVLAHEQGRVISASTYTLKASDFGKTLEFTAVGGCVVSMGATYPTGYFVNIGQTGGAVTFSGANFIQRESKLTSAGVNAAIFVNKVPAQQKLRLSGDLIV